jgi:CubicO group peptidase (beta-lactamase class C family)
MNGGIHTDFPARPVTYFFGGGGLSSTTADYARFLQLILNGGELDGKRLLGRKTVEIMLTNQVGSLRPAFGLGFELETPESDYRSALAELTYRAQYEVDLLRSVHDARGHACV